MGHSCGCGHDHDEKPEENHECACAHDHGHHAHNPTISPEDRKKLEEEIAKSGFEVKEDTDGNIVIAKKEN